jgi:hypothetical protein
MGPANRRTTGIDYYCSFHSFNVKQVATEGTEDNPLKHYCYSSSL